MIKNWSGIVRFNPKKIKFIQSYSDLINTVQIAVSQKQPLRVLGSGHSWTPLVETDQWLLNLDDFTGIESIDIEKKQVTVFAGTKLNVLSKLLFKYNLSMENLGDIDAQSIAGAISTGTHGTGLDFGIIPSQVVKLELITGNGDIITCSELENKDIFKAAQVSLGTLGVITKVTLQCVTAYKLKLEIKKETITSCLDNLNNYNHQNRNFEFYWLPYSNWVQTKFSNISLQEAKAPNALNYLNDIVLENIAFGALNQVSRLIPQTVPKVGAFLGNAISEVEKTNWSHLVYATPRLIKFNEMEYNIPIENFKDCFLEIKDCFEDKEKFKINFPTENRFLKADDIWLSPAYQRTSAHISAHVLKGMPYQHYFNTLESIFKNHDGRPHWGKLHTQQVSSLQKLYPKWNDFIAIRKQLDPNNLFINGYLRSIFGVYDK